MKRLDRVDSRARLERRRDPYWHRISEGRYVGYRRMPGTGPGTWLARRYDGERYEFKPLKDIAGLPEKSQFDEARRAAEAWFAEREKGAAIFESNTVKDWCERYIELVRCGDPSAKTKRARLPRETAARDMRLRLERLVYTDPLANVAVSKLRPDHIEQWTQRVLGRGIAESTLNRDVVALRASLNLALRRRAVTSNIAWAEALKPFAGVDGKRDYYLSPKERQKLIDSASLEIKPFLQALSLLPLRPGELAKLRVADLDLRRRMLRVPSGKTEARDVPLSEAAAALLKRCAEGKPLDAWLVSRADGRQWKRTTWAYETKIAAAAAGLPREVVCYSLRHALITDLIGTGLDVLQVARLAGTSIGMIEATYGKTMHDRARDALEKLAG